MKCLMKYLMRPLNGLPKINALFAIIIFIYIFVRNITNNMNQKDRFSDRQIKTARYAKAIGHPVRLYVLELLSKQSCCYSGDLSEELPIAKSTLSQHLKELKEAGLIQGEIEAPRIKYCINKETWREAQGLFKDLFDL